MNLSPAPDSCAALLRQLDTLYPRWIDPGLDRVCRLLDDLGNPHRRLPPVVHIAGTNGKGSVLAMMASALTLAGYTVARYTSPHLVRFNERIERAGRPIDDASLTAVLQEVLAVNAGRPVTRFESTSCAAFLYFARTGADILLLETGMGGRLDATNVIDRPALTAITPVSFDHERFLGPTLADIAAEKAGILRPGVPAVVAAQPGAAERVIRDHAARIGAPLSRHGVDWRMETHSAGGARFCGARRQVVLPPLTLAGPHQMTNAGHALACLERLPGFVLADAALAHGVASARWPGRLQRLTRGPAVDVLPPGVALWLDGGHNPAAGLALAESVRPWLTPRAQGRPRLGLVFAMQKHKDAAGFLAPLAPLAASVRAVTVPDQPAFPDPVETAALARNAGCRDVAAARSVPDAVATLTRMDHILICGSLYLAGHILTNHT